MLTRIKALLVRPFLHTPCPFAGLASPELLSMWIDAELARGRPLGALEACRTACAAQPQHGPFWCQQLAMLTQLSLAGQVRGASV